MRSNYLGIKLEPALRTLADKIEHLSSYAHLGHTTAKQVISRRRKNENVFKMSKGEKCTCKACKNAVFQCQICKFVGFFVAVRRCRGCLSSLLPLMRSPFVVTFRLDYEDDVSRVHPSSSLSD